MYPEIVDAAEKAGRSGAKTSGFKVALGGSGLALLAAPVGALLAELTGAGLSTDQIQEIVLAAIAALTVLGLGYLVHEAVAKLAASRVAVAGIEGNVLPPPPPPPMPRQERASLRPLPDYEIPTYETVVAGLRGEFRPYPTEPDDKAAKERA